MIAVVITARPSYARVKTAIAALTAAGTDVHLIVCASALLERYGHVAQIIKEDFPDLPCTECWTVYEGATLLTSAKETAALLGELCTVLSRLRPTGVLVIADRHEVLAAAQSAAYLHLPLIHLQGGERTGSIDDKVRDSITQLADVHLVSTTTAKHRVYGLTGAWDQIHVTGCPSVDLARLAQTAPPVTTHELGGAGVYMDPEKPFVLVLHHPVTNELASAADQMDAVLDAVLRIELPRVVLWPGEDAGADAMSKRIRLEGNMRTIHTLRNLPPERFLRLLTQASVLVGNSSVGIREASYLGVPVVNIGSRQHGRERAKNVVDVASTVPDITAGLMQQVRHGAYPGSTLYGDGYAGVRIAEVLSERVSANSRASGL
jgi:UDP-hydrolysing UDP-N-acetyl-D-glucosamine 2-epimerase